MSSYRVTHIRGRYIFEELSAAGLPNECTVADLFADAPPYLEDGVHDLTVSSIEGRGNSWYLHVEDARGGTAEVALGQPGRSRDRRLRILLGHADLETLAEVRAALEGQRIRVRLTTYSFGQTGRAREFRGIERA